MIPEAHTSDEADVEEASDRVDDEASNDESSDVTYDITSYGADYTVDGIVKRLRKEAFYVPSFQRYFAACETVHDPAGNEKFDKWRQKARNELAVAVTIACSEGLRRASIMPVATVRCHGAV